LAGTKPKPHCPVSNPVVIDRGTLCLQPTPKGNGLCGTRLPVSSTSHPISIDMLTWDEEKLTVFFRSVAHAKATERRVKLVWSPYNESRVINSIYAAMPWLGKPGTIDVELGAPREIDDETQKDTDHLWGAFLDRAAKGGASASDFLQKQEEIRASCLKTVSDVLDEARTISNEVIRETQRGIFKLAIIRATSTLVVKTLSTFAKNGAMLLPNRFLGKAFLTPQFLIGTTYDLALAYIDDPTDSGKAKLIAIEQKAEEKGEKKVATTLIKNLGETFQPSVTSSHQAKWLPKRLAAMEEQMTKEADAELYKKFARDSRRLARAQQDIARNSRISSALSNVKFIFLAADYYKAFVRLGKTINEAGGTGYDFLDRRLGY